MERDYPATQSTCVSLIAYPRDERLVPPVDAIEHAERQGIPARPRSVAQFVTDEEHTQSLRQCPRLDRSKERLGTAQLRAFEFNVGCIGCVTPDAYQGNIAKRVGLLGCQVPGLDEFEHGEKIHDYRSACRCIAEQRQERDLAVAIEPLDKGLDTVGQAYPWPRHRARWPIVGHPAEHLSKEIHERT